MSYPHLHIKMWITFLFNSFLLLTNEIFVVIIKALELKGEDYETNLSTKESSKK